MIEKGFVYVIPDEKQIMSEIFCQRIQMTHLDAIQKFCDTYKLGYHFNPGQYHEAPCILSLDGHLVVKTLDALKWIIMYIPEKLTDRQINWFSREYYNLMNKYRTVSACVVSGDKKDIQTHEIDGWQNIESYFKKQEFKKHS